MTRKESNLVTPTWPFIMNPTSRQAIGLLIWLPGLPAGGRGNPAPDFGGKILDLSGNSRHAPLYNTVDANGAFNPQMGLPALKFSDTSNGTADFGNASFLPTTEVTVCFWIVKNDTTNRAAGCFGLESAVGGTQLGSHCPFSDGTVYWDFGGNSAGTTRATASSLSFADWSHFIFTAGPRGMEIWYNGRIVGSHSNAPTRSGSSANFRLGRHFASTTPDLCSMNDFRLYNRQMSIGECQSLFDPQSRFDLYWELGRYNNEKVPSVAAALARNQAILIG